MNARNVTPAGEATLPQPEHAQDAPRPVRPDVPLPGPEQGAARYVERAIIGQGGMGAVTLCTDRVIGRDVAMKRILGGRASGADAQARFAREARLQGQLEHPAVVPVYDMGVDDGDGIFFTMKRVRGRTLHQLLDLLAAGDAETRLAWGQHRLLAAFAQVCMAVHYAHVRGVIHRDLKPGNIMLGEYGEVYVLDWGLARAGDAVDHAVRTRAAMPAGSTGTMEGDVLGTPGYMAPEQARGEVSSLDARADVYALGAILFELLAGEPLHRGASVGALLVSTQNGGMPAERLRDRGVAPELADACVAALSLGVARRTGTARELANAVERYLEGDRDAARRAELADEQAGRAVEACARALGPGGTAADRVSAVQCAGRALALQPSHARAARVMLELLASPPRDLPDEARAQADEEVRATTRRVARAGAWAYGAWLACMPVVFAMGLRDVGVFAALVACVSGASAACMVVARRRSVPGALLVVPFLLGSLGIALESAFAGPFMVGPAIAVVHTMFYVLLPGTAWRVTVMATGCAVTVLPLLAGMAGAVPPSLDFTGGALVVVPRMVDLPRGLTSLCIALAGVLCVLIVGVYAARFRDRLRAAEHRVRLYAWHLDQVLPRDAARPAGVRPTHGGERAAR